MAERPRELGDFKNTRVNGGADNNYEDSDQPLTFTQKTKKSLFEPPFRGLRRNVRTPSIARWKARRRLYIRHNGTLFAISYGWNVISGNMSKSAFLEGGGSLWAQFSEGRERRPPTTVGVRVAKWLPFRVVSKYLQCTIQICDNPRVWQTDRQTDGRTDGQTNGQNYDSQDHPRICSRGKNCQNTDKWTSKYRITDFKGTCNDT